MVPGTVLPTLSGFNIHQDRERRSREEGTGGGWSGKPTLPSPGLQRPGTQLLAPAGHRSRSLSPHKGHIRHCAVGKGLSHPTGHWKREIGARAPHSWTTIGSKPPLIF